MTNPLSALREAIARAIETGDALTPAFAGLDDHVLTGVEEAEVLAEVAASFPAPPVSPDLAVSDWCAALRCLIGLFQAVDALAPFEVLRDRGLAPLLALFDRRLAALRPVENGEELLFLLKVAGMYRVEAAVARTIAAARRPLAPESYLWAVLFEVHDVDHPHRARLFQALREPFPEGFLGVAYLDFANSVVDGGYASSHPFDSPAGRERLRAFLTDPRRTSRALSAAAALPFIAPGERDELLALAMDHPIADVQIEAARSSARLGSEAAGKWLVRACLEPRTAKAACAALVEMGQRARVPREAYDADLQATAEMAEWLAHPNEFGRVPDQLEVIASRTLAWPPTRDTRRLWLLHYRYHHAGAEGRPAEGVGLVGSVTFALFGEATADLPPDDLFGLYCAWELMVRGDPRAPSSRSARMGRALLDRAAEEGPDFT